MNYSQDTKISIKNGVVKIEIPMSQLKSIFKKEEKAQNLDWSILKSIRGIWRNKKIDALTYQKTVREEWD